MTRTESTRPAAWSRFRTRLRHTRGAIDLFSIMVGVIIIGVIAAGISATVFGVIPWAQDEAAKQEIGAVQLAQGVAKVKDGTGAYKTIEELVDGGYLKEPNSADPEAQKKTFVSLGSDASCYVVGNRSQTGRVFYATSASNKVKPYEDGKTNGAECADISAEAAPAQVVGGRMISNWDTSLYGCNTINLPIKGGRTIDVAWGDGSVSRSTQSGEMVAHSYTGELGDKEISVTGVFDQWSFDLDPNSSACITGVSMWSDTETHDLSSGFSMARNLRHLDAVPPNVVNMRQLFYGTTITSLPAKFDTSKVTNMLGMFSSSAITSLPTVFDTSEVTNMSGMFSLSAITSLPAVFDTRKVTDMSGMFGSSGITSLPAIFDTGSVVDMNGMFNFSLISSLPAVFDTKNVTDMSAMFSWSAISSLPAVFDTHKVERMDTMFAEARGFNIDISGWDVRAVYSKASFSEGSGLTAAHLPRWRN